MKKDSQGFNKLMFNGKPVVRDELATSAVWLIPADPQFFFKQECSICHKIYHHKRSLVRHMDRAHQVDSRTHWLFILWKRLTWRDR